MSLLGSLHIGSNTLLASQIGLQVVGQNIANANTPGYVREEVNFKPAPTQRQGSLLLGLGVQVDGIKQQIDKFLDDRLRSATSDLASSQTQEQTYQQLEGLIGELSDTDLSTSLNKFFGSVSDVLNQPESIAVRNLAILKGKTLAQDFNQLANRVTDLRSDVNKKVADSAANINRLVETVRSLNVRIASTEGGDTSGSDAVGLRDQRRQALTDLATIIDIRTEEQPNGTVTVFAGGDYLVFEGQSRHVETVQATNRGLTIDSIRISQTNAPLDTSSGELAGLVSARDDVLGGFLDKLDKVARALTFEFNKLHSSGQGLTGYDSVTSEFGTTDATAPLDAAGLPYAPVNGSFQVQVYNKKTGLTQASTITVDLNGLDHDTSLNDLATQLNAVSGVSAAISSAGKLTIKSTGADQQLAFGSDTSGVLAAIGINTFFTGSSASGLGVNALLLRDPSKLAVSRGGVGADTENAIDLANFLDRPLDSQGGDTLGNLQSRLVGEVTEASSVASSVANGFRTYQAALSGQALATSGVSIDEEAIKMLSYQHAYQASAKYIQTINELLNVLVNL